MMHGS